MDNSRLKEHWKNELIIYKVLSNAEIIYVTNYSETKCDIIFEIEEGNENAIPLIFESIDKNNKTRGRKIKTTYNLLSKRQIEIKNLYRVSYVRKFLTRIYMVAMENFIDNKDPEIRSLKSYCIDKSKSE